MKSDRYHEPTIFYGKIIVVGNGRGLIIPKKLLEYEGWKVGTQLKVFIKKEGETK